MCAPYASCLPTVRLYAQGSKAGAKAAAPAGRSVLDMLARSHAHLAERVAPAPAADSPAPAPATAPQHSRQASARAAAAVAADSSQLQPDADLALRPKRLFLSQTADSGLTAGDSEAALSGRTSGSQASEDSEPARDESQRAGRNIHGGEAVSRALRRNMRQYGGGTDGRPGGRGPDDVIDLVTPPTLAEPEGGTDGTGGPPPIVLSSLSSSSTSEQRADTPVTPSKPSGVHANDLTAAAAASSRLVTAAPSLGGGGGTTVEAVPLAAARSPSRNEQTSLALEQSKGQQLGAASQRAISCVEARTRVGTLDMTLVGGASWLLDNASPFSDIVIDLDTPSTGPASVQTPALAGRAGRKGGGDRRVVFPG